VKSKKPRDSEKIKVFLEPNDWGYETEGLWAEKISEGKYKVRNSPFFAFDISNEDIVTTYIKDGIVCFSKVIIRGGHSTYRIILKNKNEFESFWKPIQKAGCFYEFAEGSLYAIDVLPKADIDEVYSLLEEGEKQGVWEFEEGHCGHPTQD